MTCFKFRVWTRSRPEFRAGCPATASGAAASRFGLGLSEDAAGFRHCGAEVRVFASRSRAEGSAHLRVRSCTVRATWQPAAQPVQQAASECSLSCCHCSVSGLWRGSSRRRFGAADGHFAQGRNLPNPGPHTFTSLPVIAFLRLPGIFSVVLKPYWHRIRFCCCVATFPVERESFPVESESFSVESESFPQRCQPFSRGYVAAVAEDMRRGCHGCQHQQH